MAAEHIGTRDPNILRSADRPLAGKTAILTGGSRDVGGAIVQSLTREGVRVVFSYKDKPKRAQKVLDSVAEIGGEAHAVAADISTPEGRSDFFNGALATLGGEVDFLILSTSGPTPALNQEASQDLLDQTLPHMRSGGTVIRMQSVPGHFMPQLEKAFSLQQYNAVAASKHPDVKALRRRIPEMKDRGIRFLEVCPPIVAGTYNVRFAHGIDSSAETQHAQVTNKLGLPNEVTPEQVGDKVVSLLSNPDVKSGYTEFFDGVSDAQTALETIYDTPQVYVNTLQRLEEIGGVQETKGRAIASFSQATRREEPELIDDLKPNHRTWVGISHVLPDHAKGHFSDENGLPKILPGHKQIRAALETIEKMERTLGRIDGRLRLAGLESAEFFGVIPADGSKTIAVSVGVRLDGAYNVTISNIDTGERLTRIIGLKTKPLEGDENDTLLEDQLIEGAAQTVGISQVDDEESKVPLFTRLGRVEFTSERVKAGDGIEYHSFSSSEGKRGIEGAVSVYSEGRLIGAVEGINAVLVPGKTAIRLLRS